mgnify:CR=1 FL=1
MECPRLKHFRRVNADGTFGVCGHMVDAPQFRTLNEINEWTSVLEQKFAENSWPDNCVRCKDTEESGKRSIRNFSQDRHNDLINQHSEYLTIGGVIDNYCNSACLTCSSKLSTRIGKLNNELLVRDNYNLFRSIPKERIIQLDINGGEPSYSKNYQKILNDLPPNLSYLRINTNGHRVMPNIEFILNKNIHVNVTLSLDGTKNVHDYVRWPVIWNNYTNTVDSYLELRKKYTNLTLDFWTTLSVLNLNNLSEIINYTESKEIPHSYALLERPTCLSIKKTNWLTKQYTGDVHKVSTQENNDDELDAFLIKQETIRKITRIQELIR